MKKEPVAGIYRFTNKINGKAYVGQSINIDERRRTHFYITRSGKLPKSDNNVFHRAILKYGEDVFVFDILETLSRDEVKQNKEIINQAEIKWIKRLGTMSPNGYNTKSGGGQNVFMAESVKMQMRESHKGKHFYKRNNREVMCIESKIRYGSVAEAARAYKVSSTAIRLCCDGRNNKAGGVHWCYSENYSFELIERLRVNEKMSRYRRPVVCVETGEIFRGTIDAAVKLNLPRGGSAGITHCCQRGHLTAAGFHWRYLDPQLPSFRSRKPI
jgi:hypothetical protein